MLPTAVPRSRQGALSYEPRWYGLRSIIFHDGDEVEIGSRNERPMTRYFPEIVEALKANMSERCVGQRRDHRHGREATRVRGPSAANPPRCKSREEIGVAANALRTRSLGHPRRPPRARSGAERPSG